jgi:TPR repeat protein
MQGPQPAQPITNERTFLLCRKVEVDDDAEAAYELGMGHHFETNDARRQQYLARAVHLGHKHAQATCGSIAYAHAMTLAEGDPKRRETFEIAVKHFAQAARDMDHDDATHDLGVCHLHGRGVEKNEEKAEEFFRQAALRGHANAQYCVAMLVVGRDAQEAARWCANAAAQNHEGAKDFLEKMEKQYEKESIRDCMAGFESVRMSMNQNMHIGG